MRRELKRDSQLLRMLTVTGSAILVAWPIARGLPPAWPSARYRAAAFLGALAYTAWLFLVWRGKDGSGKRLGWWDGGLAVALLAFAAFIGNARILSSGDNQATRYLPLQLIEKGTLALDDVPEYRQDPSHYSVRRVKGRLLPAYPLGTGLLATPVAAIMKTTKTLRHSYEPGFALRFEKYMGALFSSLASLLVFAGLRRRFEDLESFAGACAFAFATTVFTSSGQALWSYTGEVICLAAALALLLGGGDSRREAVGAGLLVGAAFLCRPTGILVAGPFALAIARSRRRDLVAFLVSTAVALSASSTWLYVLYGHPLGGYGFANGPRAFSHTPVAGLLGTLLSPSRGLLPYQPYLLFVPLLFFGPAKDRVWRDASLAVFLAIWALVGFYTRWWGGYSIGPRLFTETAPFAAVLVVLLLLAARGRPVLQSMIATTLVLAVATQVLGAYNPKTPLWNDAATPDERPENLWSIENSQLAAAWIPRWHFRNPVAPAQLYDARTIVRVDLSAAANTRFDLDVFRANPDTGSFPRYPRLEPATFNRPRALFHFAALGQPNALTAADGASAPAVAIPMARYRLLHAVLGVMPANRMSDRTPVGEWELDYQEGPQGHVPIGLGEDVWDYTVPARHAWIPPDKIYWGMQQDADVLVHASYELDLRRALRSVLLRSRPGAAIALLALSFERPGPHQDFSIPGNLDAPTNGAVVDGNLTMSGWCQERGGSPCASVGVLVDRERVVPLGVERFPRPDVEAVVKDIGPAPRAGFRILVARPAGASESHEVAAVGETTDGRWRVFPPVRIRWKAGGAR